MNKVSVVNNRRTMCVSCDNKFCSFKCLIKYPACDELRDVIHLLAEDSFACMRKQVGEECGNSRMYHSDDMKKLLEKAGLHLDGEFMDIGMGHTLLKCKKKQ